MKRVIIILSVVLVILAVAAFSNDGALIRKILSGVAETEVIAADQKPAAEPAPAKDDTPSASPKQTDAEPQDEPEQPQPPEKNESVDPDAANNDVPADDPNKDDSSDFADMDDEEFNDQLVNAFGDVQYDPNYTGGFSGGDGVSDFNLDDYDEPDEPMESINLNNIEMKNIVQTLGEWTGKPIIPTDDEVMSKRITIYATNKVPRSQALSLILAALKAKGVIAEQSEDKIFLKPIASARLGSVPTLPADEPLAKVTDKSQIVEKYFKLENYSPTKLVSIIAPLIADYGHVTAMEDTGNLAVIDSIENLIRIERIIKQLDVPESEQMVERTFKIEKADPIEVVQVLQLILNTDSRGNSRSRSSGYRPPQPSAGSKGAATSVVIEQGEIPIRLIPVPKFNWIIARGSSDVLEQIAAWIEKLDQTETVQSEQTIIQVRFADVREVEETLDNTIRQMPEEVRAQVIVEPLVQARQLIVFGSEDNRKMIERLVAEIDLPKLDIFTEKTFKLKHADPDQIKENIDGLYGESAMNSRSSYGYNPYSRNSRSSSNQDEDVVKVIAYSTMSTVTVIASEKNMAKIEKQITEEWDIPLDIEKDQYRILTLKNSDPVQMTNLLTKLFSEDSSSSGNNNIIRMIFGGRGDAESKQKIVGSLYGMLTFEPVPETKKLIVISKIPEAYDVIEKLINELDSQEKAEVPKVITLNYADAEDLCDQLNAMLNESGTQATLQRSARGLSAIQNDSGGISSSGASAADTGNQTITPWWTRARNVTGEEMPTSNLIGQIRFIPVARSKAILVLAPPEYLEDIEKMIEELDQPGMQVMIKVVIMEVNHSNMTSMGVKLTTDNSPTNENGLSILSMFDYVDDMGAWTMSAGTNINVLIDLMVKNISAKILNQPTLWTKDNEEAVFIKGKQVAIITGDQDSSNGITRSYDYNDVGLTLRLRPNITPEKSVDMTVNLIISQVETEMINEQVAIGNLDTTTHLIINNGQTIMLGGILFQNDSIIKRKMPLLGDIPIVGELFKHTEKQVANDELLCFITPYVIDSERLDAIPAEGDSEEQLKQPFQRMEKIKGQMDKAMDWLSEEIGEERTDKVISDPDAAPADVDVVIEAGSDKTQQ